MVVIAEIESKDGKTVLDIGQLDMMTEELRQNFVAIDAHIGEMNSYRDDWKPNLIRYPYS